MSTTPPTAGDPAAMAFHGCTLTAATFERLREIRRDTGSSLRWPVPFVLPEWMAAWWRVFGTGALQILVVSRQGIPIGLAPLSIQGDTARLLGDSEVCDYLDVVTAPGQSAALMEALREDLPRRGVKVLEIGLVRSDSIFLRELAPAARRLGLLVECHEKDLTQELSLPSTWEGYLHSLDAKPRHEVRRKLRRLKEAGQSRFRVVSGGASLQAVVDRFLRMFRAYRPDKARFMTPAMADYFGALAEGLALRGLLRLCVLDLDGQTVAVAFCLQLGQTMYLYNNAFDDRMRALSVGLICKLLSIRAAIEAGAQRYDFLRGAETYKRQLGGRPAPLYHCRITLIGQPASHVQALLPGDDTP